MHGVSEVIAIILILMITISIAGLAYTFMSSTMASTTSAASSAVDSTTSSMLTSFIIENIDIAKVYIRNTGQNPISSLSVYVNDEPAMFNVTPLSISSGQIGTITIYSFIPDGATLKVTSPSGFSASKVADECSRAAACWKLDDGSGTTVYDSSPNRNTGILGNATGYVPSWVAGIYGSALNFTGTKFVNISNSPSVRDASTITIQAWIKSIGSTGTTQVIYNHGADVKIIYFDSNRRLSFGFRNTTVGGGFGPITYISSSLYVSYGTWQYVSIAYNTTHTVFVLDGNAQTVPSNYGNIFVGSTSFSAIGVYSYNFFSSPFNGMIDEIRIYDRAIY